jgi:hypothetical protein
MIPYTGQKLILIDELQASINPSDRTVHWKRNVLELLKKLTETFPISCFFGGVHHDKYPYCKVIVTSNFARPSQQDSSGVCPFARRYIEFSSMDQINL